MSSYQKAFQELVHKYRNYPEYIGIKISHPNQPGAVGDTLIHLVSRRGELDDLITLLGAGGDVNIPGDMGNTPLHGAALSNQVKAAKLLIEHGANRNAKNEFGETPYDVALALDNKDVIKLLK